MAVPVWRAEVGYALLHGASGFAIAVGENMTVTITDVLVDELCRLCFTRHGTSAHPAGLDHILYVSSTYRPHICASSSHFLHHTLESDVNGCLMASLESTSDDGMP